MGWNKLHTPECGRARIRKVCFPPKPGRWGAGWRPVSAAYLGGRGAACWARPAGAHWRWTRSWLRPAPARGRRAPAPPPPPSLPSRSQDSRFRRGRHRGRGGARSRPCPRPQPAGPTSGGEGGKGPWVPREPGYEARLERLGKAPARCLAKRRPPRNLARV